MANKRLPTELELVLGSNLGRLMESRKDVLDKEQLVAKATSSHLGAMDQTTVGRIKKAEHTATLIKIEALAHAFSIPAWQLLVPNLNVSDPPLLVMGDEKLLYTSVQKVMHARRTNETDEETVGGHHSGVRSGKSQSKQQTAAGKLGAATTKKKGSTRKGHALARATK